MASEIARLLEVVDRDPSSWETWVGVAKSTNPSILGEADKSGDISLIRSVYDKFLAIYPLCFGYWKKYADHEWRVATVAARSAADADWRSAASVYERSVKAASHESSTWSNFIAFAIASIPDPAYVRSIFERWAVVCGTDPKSAAQWSSWLDFETKRVGSDGAPAHVLSKQIRNGCASGDVLLVKLRQLAQSRPVQELVLPEDAAGVEAMLQHQVVDGPPFDKEVFTRDFVLQLKTTEAEHNADITAARAAFEASLGKRTWFHVTPLQATLLSAWRAYLDFEESSAHNAAANYSSSGGNAVIDAAWARVEKLYGRCLVACAAYAEFWLRYAAFRREYPDAARAAGQAVGIAGRPSDILRRASNNFCPHRVDVTVALADALEEEGDRRASLGVYELCVGSAAPQQALPLPGWASSSVEIGIRYAQALTRNGGDEDGAEGATGIASVSLRGLLDRLTDPSALAPVYSELARVHAVSGDVHRASEAWREGSVRCASTLHYWQAWAGAAAAYGLPGGPAAVYARSLGLDDDGRPKAAGGSHAEGEIESEPLPRDEDRAVAWLLYMEALRADRRTPAVLIAVSGDEFNRWSRRLAAGGASGGSVTVSPGMLAASAGRKRPLGQPMDETGGTLEPASKVPHTA